LISFSKKTLTIALVFAGAAALSACSTKPSPWSKTASAPWELRTDKAVESDAVVENGTESDYPDDEKLSVEPPATNTSDEIGDTVVSLENPNSSQVPPPTELTEETPVSDSVANVDDAAQDEQTQQINAPIEYEMDSSVVIVPNGGISDQPGSMYAVQVVASSGLKKLHQFIEKYSLSDRWIVETNVDGQVWYVLMTGLYVTKGEADDALANLRDFGTQPWIRSVRSVQMVMNTE